jgi:hypothetical protein
MTTSTSVQLTTQVRPRHEGGGHFAPARGGGSGANRVAGDPVEGGCHG